MSTRCNRFFYAPYSAFTLCVHFYTVTVRHLLVLIAGRLPTGIARVVHISTSFVLCFVGITRNQFIKHVTASPAYTTAMFTILSSSPPRRRLRCNYLPMM
jgi:hypothetical protein